jgi:hypothetical protein
MTTARFDPKDPADVYAYDFDLSAWLTPLAATISGTPTYSASPAGLTLTHVGLLTGNTGARVRISGGTAGTDYTVTCTATCTDSIVLERSAVLPVRNQ